MAGTTLLVEANAHAAGPRIAVIVASHLGLPADGADQIAGAIADAVAARIEGEALSGTLVRDLLPPGSPEPGCQERPTCGRAMARALKSDEALFLELRKVNKVVAVTMHRVARDPERIPSENQLRISGPKARRTQAVEDAVAVLYPVGSVIPFAEQPAPPVAATRVIEGAPGDDLDAAAVAADADADDDDERGRARAKAKSKAAAKAKAQAKEQAKAQAKEQAKELTANAGPKDDRPAWKKPWFIPVVAGAGALLIAGVAVGIAFGIPPQPAAPTITLPF